MDRNADCCVNTADEKVSYTAITLVNVGPITSEIFLLIKFCMFGVCRDANIRIVLVKKHSDVAEF